ncbi:putative Tripeptidyl aminopeptidase [Glarea lozoyensis 74030]|uniref:Putative Tripeptidyl aminopeptidase n=1 Tax=Glarea lozoyensis (strain ATCC 74030 / MF5533) TaxID=1104152 RepID=H0EZ26_GLAL7|nr:putative Tripeptidyl aminopeptidase [Glarea lozoyensis 74030]
MEKTPLLTSRRDKGKSRRFEGVSLLVVATLSLGISLWVLLRAHAFLRYESPGFWDLNGKEGVEEGGGEWRWKDVSLGLADVPLDWVEPSDKLRASIAVIRLNATIRGDEYKGAVFINPGGPGGSGIWFIKHFSPYYQTVVGKNYDIISFDPRGVGFTAPHISCLTPSSSLLWSLLTPPVLDAHAGILHDAYARAQAFSQACSPFQNSTSALAYVSTASTARDMYALVQATGNEKLNYWGFSYGTYLGVTPRTRGREPIPRAPSADKSGSVWVF